MTLTIGSLFSGIGGLELGAELAAPGATQVAWQCELDPYCRDILAAHYPHARRFVDVSLLPALICARRKRGIGPWCDECCAVDVVCGGFPCQDVSLAGKGAGLAGARSGLWREYIRIVRLVRPRFVLIENVPGLVRRGLDVVVADLAAAGFAVDAARIAARDVGAPHIRERIFIVAHGHGQRREQQRLGGLLDSERAACGHDADGCSGEAVADAEGERPYPGMHGGAALAAPGERGAFPPSPDDVLAWGLVPADSQPSLCRLADGAADRLARRADELKALGNAVVPQTAAIAWARLFEIAARLDAPLLNARGKVG